MNVLDTRKLDQTKGACQSLSCSMEYSSFVYIYRKPSFNNAVSLLSLAYRRCWFLALVFSKLPRPTLIQVTLT